MSENFVKFKNKAFRIRLIKSIFVGVTVGFITGGALLLLSKYGFVPLEWIFSLLIGIGAALLTGGGVWFLFRLSDKKLAEQLDKRFTLHEKVQTMLEYEKAEGAMVTLQREDAEASLEAIPAKKWKFRRLWAYVTCFVLSVALLATSFVLNPQSAVSEPGPAYDPPFALSEFERQALNDLISDVRASGMESPYRENVVLSLMELLDDLTVAEKESEKTNALTRAVDGIYAETYASSSTVEIVNALWSIENASVKALAKAVNHYSWSTGKEWDDFCGELANFKNSFIHADMSLEEEERDEEKILTETLELVSAVSSNIPMALMKSGIDGSDPVYTVLMRLNDVDEILENGTRLCGFTAIATSEETLSYDEIQTTLSTTLEGMKIEIFDVLEQENVNTDTGEYTMTRLSNIFGYKLPRFKRPSLNDSSAGGGNSDQPGNNNSFTDAENVYGSKEKVLDPLTNEYVEYGEILGRYSTPEIDKAENGEFTEEEIEAIKKYFNILKVGFDKEEDGSNE